MSRAIVLHVVDNIVGASGAAQVSVVRRGMVIMHWGEDGVFPGYLGGRARSWVNSHESRNGRVYVTETFDEIFQLMEAHALHEDK